MTANNPRTNVFMQRHYNRLKATTIIKLDAVNSRIKELKSEGLMSVLNRTKRRLIAKLKRFLESLMSDLVQINRHEVRYGIRPTTRASFGAS